ncbi:MAG: hypothetical protein BRC57_16295 [Cyanobacteria bacterium QS_8_48_54]|nr:MAG: hypothetical protein BRC57_16295 [Cyanobacteria bacterium QS_8_48_54]
MLLIAIAYTIGGINGQKLQQQAGQKYISRVQELQRYAKHDDGHLTVANYFATRVLALRAYRIKGTAVFG